MAGRYLNVHYSGEKGKFLNVYWLLFKCPLNGKEIFKCPLIRGEGEILNVYLLLLTGTRIILKVQYKGKGQIGAILHALAGYSQTTAPSGPTSRWDEMVLTPPNAVIKPHTLVRFHRLQQVRTWWEIRWTFSLLPKDLRARWSAVSDQLNAAHELIPALKNFWRWNASKNPAPLLESSVFPIQRAAMTFLLNMNLTALPSRKLFHSRIDEGHSRCGSSYGQGSFIESYFR